MVGENQLGVEDNSHDFFNVSESLATRLGEVVSKKKYDAEALDYGCKIYTNMLEDELDFNEKEWHEFMENFDALVDYTAAIKMIRSSKIKEIARVMRIFYYEYAEETYSKLTNLGWQRLLIKKNMPRIEIISFRNKKPFDLNIIKKNYLYTYETYSKSFSN